MKHFLTNAQVLFFSFCVTVGHTQTVWKTFNHKNGFTIQLPKYFSPGLLVAAGTLQWFDNSVDKNILVTVESFGNGTQSDLQSSFLSTQKTFTLVTYKVRNPTWFVVSGQDDMGISYVKTIIRNGIQHQFRITYPPSQKALLDKIIPKISASFK